MVNNTKKNNPDRKTNKTKKSYKFIKIKPTNEIKEEYYSKYTNPPAIFLQYYNNKSNTDILIIKDINKVNILFGNYNYDIKYDLLINTYEYITMEYINKKYYIGLYNDNNNDNEVKYDYNKFINKSLFKINNKVFIPLSNFNSNNIYNKKYILSEILIANNLIEKKTKTYLSLDIFGPYEIKNNTLYLYNDLQSAINDINLNNKYISIYDYESWGLDLNYNDIVHESKLDVNINFDYLIQKITSHKDILKINNFIFEKNNYKPVDFIYIRNQSIFLSNECRNEYYYINYLVKYLNVIFNVLGNNGVLVINLPSIPITKQVFHLLYYISTFFRKTKFYNTKLKISEYVFIFTKFNKKLVNSNILNKLKTLTSDIIEYYNKIENKGLKFNYYNNVLTCIEKGDKKNNIMIYDLFNIDTSTINYINFKKWYYYIFNKVVNRLKQITKNFNYVIKIPKDKLHDYINLTLLNNLNYSIAFCEEYNFDINRAYISENGNISNNILTSNEFIKTYFPEEKDINYKKLQMSRIGLYSISPEYISNFLMEKINKHFTNLKQLTITEANGGIGGDSLILSKLFKFINVIELNEEHSKIIENNLKVYKRTHFKVYNDDYTKVYKTLKQDIVYFDPPWGGLNYKNYKFVDLFLSSINIIDIIINLIKINPALSIIMKAPYNYNINNLEKELKTKKTRKIIHTYKIGTTIILFII